MEPPSTTAESIAHQQEGPAGPKPAARRKRSLWSAPWLLVAAIVKLGPRELDKRYLRHLTDDYT